MTSKKHFAYLDILGFKEMINHNNLDDMIKIYDQFKGYIQMKQSDMNSKTDQRGKTVFNLDLNKFNSITISDTFVFWIDADTEDALYDLICFTYRLIRFFHNQRVVYLRGVITSGDFYFDDNGGSINSETGAKSYHTTMLGKALVDASMLEKKIEMIGCIITEDAINYEKSKNASNWSEQHRKLIDEEKIVKYNVPLKNDDKNSYWTINWVQKNSNKSNLYDLEKGFENDGKLVNNENVKLKINNSIDYYNHVYDKKSIE